MNTDSAREDLAYLRTLVQGGEDNLAGFGQAYFAAGVCYGGQILLSFAQGWRWLPNEGLPALAIALGPTVVFIAALIWIIGRFRQPPAGSVAARTIGAVFGAVGLANLVLIAIIGSAAAREQSQTIFMIYPCTVFVLQGMAWLVMGAVRRRKSMALMGLAWFGVAAAMGAAIQDMAWFAGVTGFGLFALMVVPGWVMMRRDRRPAG